MRIYNYPHIIPASTVMNATINSTAMELAQILMYSVQIFFTGTPTGSFKLQSCGDTAQYGSSPINWTDVANSSVSVAAAGNITWNVSDVAYNYVRVVYSDTSSGSSTAIVTTATFNGKGF